MKVRSGTAAMPTAVGAPTAFWPRLSHPERVPCLSGDCLAPVPKVVNHEPVHRVDTLLVLWFFSWRFGFAVVPFGERPGYTPTFDFAGSCGRIGRGDSHTTYESKARPGHRGLAAGRKTAFLIWAFAPMEDCLETFSQVPDRPFGFCLRLRHLRRAECASGGHHYA